MWKNVECGVWWGRREREKGLFWESSVFIEFTSRIFHLRLTCKAPMQWYPRLYPLEQMRGIRRDKCLWSYHRKQRGICDRLRQTTRVSHEMSNSHYAELREMWDQICEALETKKEKKKKAKASTKAYLQLQNYLRKRLSFRPVHFDHCHTVTSPVHL